MVLPVLWHLNPLRPPVEPPFPRCAPCLSPLPGAPLPSALAPHPLLPSPPGRLPSVCLVLCTPPLSPPSITPLRAQQTDTSPTSSPRCLLSSLGVWLFPLLSYHRRIPPPHPPELWSQPPLSSSRKRACVLDSVQPDVSPHRPCCSLDTASCCPILFHSWQHVALGFAEWGQGCTSPCPARGVSLTAPLRWPCWTPCRLAHRGSVLRGARLLPQAPLRARLSLNARSLLPSHSHCPGSCP